MDSSLARCHAHNFLREQVNAVHVLHIDPARNIHRFYRLDVQPDLFGVNGQPANLSSGAVARTAARQRGFGKVGGPLRDKMFQQAF